MTQGSSKRARRTVVMLAVALVVVASIFGTGVWLGTGGLSFLNAPTPPIIYVTPEPAPTATAETVSPTPLPTDVATSSVETSTPAGPTALPPPTAHPATAHPVTPAPILPNLRFSGGGTVPFFCGEPATVSAHITNSGLVPTAHSTTVRLTDTFSGHEDDWGAKTVPILGPGAIFDAEFTFTITSGCGMQHVFTFRVDPSNDLPETSELDNVYTMDQFVERAGPNLRVFDVQLSTPHPRCAIGFDVTVSVANAGSTTTGHAFEVRVVDKAGSAETPRVVSVPTMAAHTSRTATVHLTLLSHCGETHQLVATADYDDSVDETYEADNASYHSYTLYSS